MSNDIRVFQLNNYVRPKLQENKSKGWVLNGRNNSFYQDLIDRKKGSPTHSTILNSFNNLLYGNGISAKNVQNNMSDFLKFKTILSNKDLRRIIADFNLYGEASMFVVKDKKGDISKIEHVAKEKIVPSIENEDGEIESYFFCKDWSNTNKNQPEEFSAFGTSNDAIEIYCISPYNAGKNYFSDPDYLAGIPYAQMEEEIANLYVNSIRKGLSAGYIINVPNGNSLTEEEKEGFKKQIEEKLTGSPNAMSFVLSFNGVDAEITVTPFPVNENVHKQWEFLTGEAKQQLLTAHAIVSPMLFGIKNSTGLGNNADELDTAEAQLMKRVVQPKQRYILEALDDILNAYNINLNLFFVPLTDSTQTTDVAMSSHVCCSDEKKKTDLDLFIELGEDQDIEGYDLESVTPVNYEEEDSIKLATETGIARSNAKSKFDTEFSLIRYRYAGNEAPEREFCKRMMQAKKIYRREDIDLMGERNVNPGFGKHPNPNNPYSIWKYKGGGLLSASYVGGTCKHYWEKLTYRQKGTKVDVKSPIAQDNAKVDKANGIAGLTPHSR